VVSVLKFWWVVGGFGATVTVSVPDCCGLGPVGVLSLVSEARGSSMVS
jgi:hypothetical protein